MNMFNKLQYKSVPTILFITLIIVSVTKQAYANNNYLLYLTQAEQIECQNKTVNFDLPFTYDTTKDNLRLMSEAGLIDTSMYPWGTHVPPYTGHEEGNRKSDWAAWAALDYPELTVLVDDNNNQICDDENETCGMLLNDILHKNPPYIAPETGFRVKTVVLERFYDSVSEATGGKMWLIEGNICNFHYELMHVGQLSSTLREGMINAGYKDPNTVTIDDEGVNLITDEENPISFNKGEIIAYPEMMARQVEGHPGYYQGSLEFQRFPNSHIEFSVRDYKKTDQSIHFPMFLLLQDDALLDKLRYYLAKPFPKFSFNDPSMDWLWRAEAVSWTNEAKSFYSYDSIHSSLGGWFEKAGIPPCNVDEAAVDCDQKLSIFPIHKNSEYYKPALYSSPHINYLMFYRHLNSTEEFLVRGAYGELLRPHTPDPLTDVLTVKWRDPMSEKSIYQKIAYRVSPAQELMRAKFGPIVSDFALLADIPTPDGTEVCDGVNVVCFNHKPPEAQ
ncbi:MAG: hypothetical protein OEV42_19105 [Deltaproteobacteria bacterium]|nr:hypothetical protein [Deltaproteobacteria bacterium]